MTIDKYTHYSYRTTIENYLFNKNSFYEFLQEKNLTDEYGIHSIGEVHQIFIKAAKKIAYYQALRHTMGKMRIPTDFGTTWILEGSGTLPNELDDNPHCRQKALSKVNEAKNQTNSWTEQEFDAVLNSFYNRFNKDVFFDNSDFLIWFQGKDFATSLSRLLPEFPMKTYYQFAKKRFDYTQFTDLVSLRSVIESYM